MKKKYVVALSGGADSVCLLLKLLERGEVAAAAHCNFHLRGEESERDELFVRLLCKERGVKLYVNHFDTTKEAEEMGESIEMAARRLRYAWFATLVTQLDCDAVAVGHHMEDNAETLLLNLMRGTGLKGLTGMQVMGKQHHLLIYRPLLDMSKQDILTYLQQQHQLFVTDSTNNDVHYKRNKIRHELLPLLQHFNPSIVPTLNATASYLTDAFALYNIGIKKVTDSCRLRALPKHPGIQEIDAQQLLALPYAGTVLFELVAGYGFQKKQITNALDMRVGGLIETDGAWLTRTEHSFQFGRKPTFDINDFNVPIALNVDGASATSIQYEGFAITFQPLERSVIDSLKCCKEEIIIDAEAIEGTLRLRVPRKGEKFHPFGMKGMQLVSDFLTNRHYSRIEKLLTPIIADDAGILWVVGERADEHTRISANTKRVIKITVRFS